MNIKIFLKQYKKDLIDLYNGKKSPNDFSLKYFLLLGIPDYIIAIFLFFILYFSNYFLRLFYGS